jgi:hypothetical protein
MIRANILIDPSASEWAQKLFCLITQYPSIAWNGDGRDTAREGEEPELSCLNSLSKMK